MYYKVIKINTELTLLLFMGTFSMRLPDDLEALLEEIATLEERSKSSIVKRGLRIYLEDLRDYYIAEKGYKRYVASGKKGISLEELAEKADIDLKTL
jgi:predicted DNA-binding protein